MRSKNEPQAPPQPINDRELQLLSEIEATPEVTQRQLSKNMGIALGLTNVLLRNLAQKGYVRATEAGWKRWFYAITPEGFSHKFKLTLNYIHRVLDHYQNVRQTLREQLEPLALNQESRVAVYGTGEFAELVYLGLREIGIEEIDFYGSKEPEGRRFLGILVRDIGTLNAKEYDRIIVGSLGGSESASQVLLKQGTTSHQMVTFFSGSQVKDKS